MGTGSMSELWLRIQKQSAYPDVCPECGLAVRHFFKGKLDTYKLLKMVYDSPSMVVSRAVPGWKGYIQWWFVCTHRDAIRDLVYGKGNNPFAPLLRG